jgi:hypothetical protein
MGRPWHESNGGADLVHTAVEGARALRAGDYHRAAAGSTHAGNSTVGGCLVLIVEAEA